MQYDYITILGPTAVGKTTIACNLAYLFNGEIISADSRQVYRGMDLGTGKDYSDYNINNISIPYHLIDIADPTEEYNVFRFREEFTKAFTAIEERGNLPILAGGTGMYLSSVLQDYNMVPVDFNSERSKQLNSMESDELEKILVLLNPDTHNITDLNDKARTIKAILIAEAQQTGKDKINRFEKHSLIIGVTDEREVIKSRIRKRLKTRLKEGMIEEAESLLSSGVTHEKLQFFGLEYKFLSLYIKGELNYNDMYQKLNSAIAAFAKRQMTWYRRMEKNGVEINWVKSGDVDAAISLADKYFERKR